MTLAKTRSVSLVGVDGFVVDVEAAITSGVPGLHLVGLPDAALNEARDRVRAAIYNSGEDWPYQKRWQPVPYHGHRRNRRWNDDARPSEQ